MMLAASCNASELRKRQSNVWWTTWRAWRVWPRHHPRPAPAAAEGQMNHMLATSLDDVEG